MYFHKIQNPKPVLSQAEGSKIKIIALVFTGILACFHLAEAQQTRKIPKLGVLADVSAPHHDAFDQGLRDVGYIEGENIIIESAGMPRGTATDLLSLQPS